ncbi:MAG: hypothetical protein NW217_09140 [Hyphomicrobiaceae bacterium]|nr:hypothetical protein [Hyphomicrobiaceae bacterium]
MVWFRSIAGVIVLVLISPILSAVIAGWIASSNGCTLNEGNVHPCLINGVDWGDTLYTMFVVAWLGLATIPYAVILLGVWLVVEIVMFVRRRVRSRA